MKVLIFQSRVPLWQTQRF